MQRTLCFAKKMSHTKAFIFTYSYRLGREIRKEQLEKEIKFVINDFYAQYAKENRIS